VPDGTAAQQQPAAVNLKDPVMAAFLAWLIPGLGHLYQGRTAKAVLFFVCIMGIFVYGLYLGGNKELGYGRAVYFAFRDNDWHLPYICQVFVGLPALPACVQAMRMGNGKEVAFNGFMAPPCPIDSRGNKILPENSPNYNQPTLDTLNHDLNRFLEFATFYTMIAGLLNILAIYDAASGPVAMIPVKKYDRPDKSEEKAVKP
jgi:hypothetical protein